MVINFHKGTTSSKAHAYRLPVECAGCLHTNQKHVVGGGFQFKKKKNQAQWSTPFLDCFDIL